MSGDRHTRHTCPPTLAPSASATTAADRGDRG